jgi:hypothetical protein
MRKKLLKLTANLDHIEIWSAYVFCSNEKTIRAEVPILVLWVPDQIDRSRGRRRSP